MLPKKKDVKEAVTCVSKCFFRYVTRKERHCLDYLKPGPTIKKCFLAKRGECGIKCNTIKRCYRFYKKKNCGKCKNCTVSRIKCIYGKKCAKECVLRYFEKCFLAKLPSYKVTKCQDVFKRHKVRDCLRKCTHIRSWETCWHHCTKHAVFHHSKRCFRVIMIGKAWRCSLKKVVKGCHKSCTTFPKQCFNICSDRTCGHSKCHCCKLKCTQKNLFVLNIVLLNN